MACAKAFTSKCQCEGKRARVVLTTIGVPQGGMFSPVLYTLCSANPLPTIRELDLIPKHMEDHTYASETNSATIIEQQLDPRAAAVRR